MIEPDRPPHLPASLALLAALYFAASLAHFGHNAEYIAFYPGMPAWITRGTVYLAWAGVSSVGVFAAILFLLRWRAAALVALGTWGALGLDGLAHYTLALCSEHTLATNLTIGAEAISGLVVLVISAVLLARHLAHHLVTDRHGSAQEAA